MTSVTTNSIELKSFEYDKKNNLSSNEFTGHNCVVYIKNPDKDEAFIGGYDCSPDFGKYGNTNKRNTSNNTVPVLNIKNKVTIRNLDYPVTSIYFAAFRLCESLNTITFEKPSSLTSIGANAFYSSSLTSIEIPNSVTSISEKAFIDCEKLSEITFEKPSSITNIGEIAFAKSSLTSIEIPNSVTSIGEYAFMKCENLSTITFEEGSTLQSIEDFVFAQSGLTSIKIPNSVTSIGESAFEKCENLKSITFEDESKLQSIGENAFSKSSLTSIEIPKSVTIINIGAFFGCMNLTSIEIPNSVTSIGINAFEYCKKLSKITFQEGSKLQSIGKMAFKDSGLTEIEIPNSVTSIGESAFDKSLSKITFQEGSKLQSIGKMAFKDSGLTSIEIPNSVTSIGDSAFYASGLTSIEIPNSVTSIGNSAFYNSKLISITFEKGSKLVSIPLKLFQFCTNLTSIEIPESVKSIGNSAFYSCEKLSEITFEKPSSITSIGENAFKYSGLTLIEIPKSITSIGNSAFSDCENLISITFEEGSLIPIEEQKNIIKKYQKKNQTTTVSVEVLVKSENIKKKENDDKIIYHPILSNDNLLSKWKEHRPELFRGYNDMCELMHGYTNENYFVLDSDLEQKYNAPVLNLNNETGKKKENVDIYLILINYIKTNINIVPTIKIDNGSDLSGLSREFCTIIGDYIKLTFMTDLIPDISSTTSNQGGGSLEPPLQESSAQETSAQVPLINNTQCIKNDEGKYKKMFDINKLNEENIKTLSLVLYFFMYTMSPFCKSVGDFGVKQSLYLSLGISFSDFTLMIIFGMFKKIGEKKLLSKIVEDIINYISNVEKNYFVEPSDNVTECDKENYVKAYYPSKTKDGIENNPEKRTPFQSELDNKLEYYIGVMNSLDESVFEEEIIQDINIIQDIPICLPFPLKKFIIKLVYNLYSFNERKEIISEINSDYNQTTYEEILKKILEKIKLLESINTNLKEILKYTPVSSTCFTENDEPLSLYDLSILISSPLIVTKESVIDLLKNTKANKENNTQDMKDAIGALEYTLNSVEMNNNNKLKQFLKFITGSTNLPPIIQIVLVEHTPIVAHTCFNKLDIKRKSSFENLKKNNPNVSYNNKKYEDFIKDIILEAIPTDGFAFAGGVRNRNRNRNRISNKKISKKYKKKYSKINIINNKNNKNKIQKNKYSKNMKYKLLNISKSKKYKKM
jgi:hypothetical protein